MIGSLQESELSPRVVVAVVGMPRENDAETKIVTRWLQQLLAEDRNHLPTPEELILEIDEAAGASQRADVGLEDAEVAAWHRFVGSFRHGADHLDPAVAGVRGRVHTGEVLSGRGLPAHREMGADIRNRGTCELCCRVMPPERAASVVGGDPSRRSPARAVRSMPPTNATVPSTMTSFS